MQIISWKKCKIKQNIIYFLFIFYLFFYFLFSLYLFVIYFLFTIYYLYLSFIINDKLFLQAFYDQMFN